MDFGCNLPRKYTVSAQQIAFALILFSSTGKRARSPLQKQNLSTMTLPTINQFLEDVKLRSSYDSASDRDDLELLHPLKVRDITSRHPRYKHLLLLTHLLTSLLTLLITLFLTSMTRQDNSNGRCYDKFNPPCKHTLPSKDPKPPKITPNGSHYLRAPQHPLHRRRLRIHPLVPLSLQRPPHARRKPSMAAPPIPRDHIRQRLRRRADRAVPQRVLSPLPANCPLRRGALRRRRGRRPPPALPALPLAGPLSRSRLLCSAGGDEEGGAGYV